MDRDLVFRLKAEVDTPQVAASLKQIGTMIQDASLTLPVQFTLPDLLKLQQQLSVAPLQIPVTLVATGMTGMSLGGLAGMTLGGAGVAMSGSGTPLASQPLASQPPASSVGTTTVLPNPSVAAAAGVTSPLATPSSSPADAAVAAEMAKLQADQEALNESLRKTFGVKSPGDKDAADGKGEDAEAASKKAQQALDEAAAKIDMINDRVNGTMRQGLYQTFEAVTRLGRGFAYIGAVGEKDMQKVLDVLMKVEATINLVRGGVDVFRGLTQAVSSYQEGLKAISALQATATTARGASQAVDVASGVSDLAGGAGDVAGVAALARSGKGAAGAGGVGGAAKLAGMSIIPQALAALAAVVGGGVGINSAREFIGDAGEYGLGGGARAGGQNEVVGSFLAQTMTWLSKNSPKAVREWGAKDESSKGVYDRLAVQQLDMEKRDKELDKADEAKSRRMLERGIAGREQRELLGVAQRSDADYNDVMQGRMAWSSDTSQREMDKLRRAEQGFQFLASGTELQEAESSDWQVRAERRGWSQTYNEVLGRNRIAQAAFVPTISKGLERQAVENESQTRDVAQQLELARKQAELVSARMPGVTERKTDERTTADKLEGTQRIADLEQRMVDLGKQRLTIEQEVKRERETGLKESVAALQQQVALHRQAAAAALESVSGNQQRLGLLDESGAEQTRAAAMRMKEIQALEKGDPNDVEAQDKAQRMRQAMSTQDLDLLKSTGFKETSEFVRSEALRRSKARGFDKLFGAEEAEQIAMHKDLAAKGEEALKGREGELKEATAAVDEDRLQGKIEVALKDNRTLEVKIERSDDAPINEAVAKIIDEMDRRDEAMKAAIEARVTADRSKVVAMSAAEALAAGMSRSSRAK